MLKCFLDLEFAAPGSFQSGDSKKLDLFQSTLAEFLTNLPNSQHCLKQPLPEALQNLGRPEFYFTRPWAFHILEALFEGDFFSPLSTGETSHFDSACTFLHLAVLGMRLPFATDLLADGRYNINALDRRGMCPLHYALLRSSESKEDVLWVHLLLEKGANPTIASPLLPSPLLFAIMMRRSHSLEFLLTSKLIDQDNKEAAINFAKQYAVTEPLKLLDAKDKIQKTPIPELSPMEPCGVRNSLLKSIHI